VSESIFVSSFLVRRNENERGRSNVDVIKQIYF